MLKVAVIGGGSTYTPELVNGFLERFKTFPLDELWLMDINPERLETVGGFAKRMVEAKGSPFKIVLSQDQREAVHNANYVITQLRVGMMQARVNDEYLGRRHGLIGQETTGVGGMAKALRTIPVILSIAHDMRALAAPGATLINFTNPSGLVTEALFRYVPEVAAVGVCNIPITTKMEIIKGLEKVLLERIDPAWAELKTLGLNHLSWHYDFTIKGEDMWSPIIDTYVNELRSQVEPEWDPDTIASLRMMPNSYLKYYYYTGRKLAEQQQWPPSRGETVMDIEKDLLQQYADPSLTEPPADLMLRGGAYYSTVATQLLDAMHNDRGETHVCNVRQDGAVRGWDKDWVLELPCKVDAKGIHPLPADPLPPVCYGLLAQVKSYELLTVEAAVHGDRRAAYQALLAHPLGPAADQLQTVLDDMLKTNQAFLPQF
ncbi:MAG TPA: 6-phospho-beta-glucosidase [Longilinea sp.]|nr:6-phospho-beta-glucosidase [Longilinea sp.]